MYDKIFEEFIREVKQNGTYASIEEIRQVAQEMLDILKKHPGYTPEEYVEAVMLDNINYLERLKEQYPVPGYTVGVNVHNINVKMFGGNRDSLGTRMTGDELFDIASMSKFYCQIVAYNLIKEGYFNFDDRIVDLDPRFVNLGDVTVGDVLLFAVEYNTPGRVANQPNIEQALSKLFNMTIVQKGRYNYSDMGLMMLKEIMEKVTRKPYPKLVEKYITKKLHLKETFLVLPKRELKRVTGTPNAKQGMPNDPSALSVGGFSGHAGVFASSDDLIKLGQGVVKDKLLPKEMMRNAFLRGVAPARGIMGNTFVATPEGTLNSSVDKLEPSHSFAIQGSTRTQLNVSNHSIITSLLNPDSMSIERAKEEEAKINMQRAREGKAPLSLVKQYRYDRNGKVVEYEFIDSRQMVPMGKAIDPLTKQNAILALRLRFLNKVLTEYEHYNKQVNVTKGM